MPRRSRPKAVKLTMKRYEGLVWQATVDCHDEQEALGGWACVLDDHLELPFTTVVLGVEVEVTRVHESSPHRLVAICEREGERQAIGLSDLPLPSPLPAGAEWIEAWRRWADRL
jgi:hypothetical protein